MNKNEYIDSHFEIMFSMDDCADYNKYLDICKSKSIEPLTLNLWVSRVGTYFVAKKIYPNDPIEESYVKIILDMRTKIAIPKSNYIGTNTTGSCCGGGKVL